MAALARAVEWRGAWIAPALLIPVGALAEQAVRELDASSWRFWFAFGAVQGLAGIGWCASSLARFAGWIDPTGGPLAQFERRLVVLQGVAISVLASNAAYYGGFYGQSWPEIYCFIGAALGAYGGDKFLSPLLQRATSMWAGIFGKSTGD